MHKVPTTDIGSELPTSSQSIFSSKSPRKKRNLLIIVLAAVLVIAVAAGLFYILQHRQVLSGSSSQSMTLYYRDGKTVLWDSAKNQDSDTEVSGFVARVKADLAATYSTNILSKGDWRVTTTLDFALQQEAKEQVAANQAVYDRQGIINGALIAQDVTNGQIVSWVGGLKDFDNNPDTVSEPTMVGSLALPLTYAALIENTTNYGAGSVVVDQPGALEGYPCTNKVLPTKGGNCLHNYDDKYVGELTLRQALGALRLVPAAQAGQTVGTLKLVGEFNKLLPNPDKGSRFACYEPGSTDFNSENEGQCYLAAALGDGLYARPEDMIQAYATLANGGKSVQQASYLSVTIDGKSPEAFEPKTVQAIREDTAYIINDILSDPTSSYRARRDLFRINDSEVSVQTGISSDEATASMVQYTNKYAVGFWGMTESGEAIEGFADVVTTPVVTGWLSVAQADKVIPDRAKPSGIQELPSPVIALDLINVSPSPAIDFYPSWYK